jgi:hypothetical protein
MVFEDTTLMPVRLIRHFIFQAGLVAWAVLPLAACQAARVPPGQRIFVIAVKTPGHASLFHRCPPAARRIGPLKPVVLHAPELFPGSGAIVPGGIPDEELKRRIEQEILQQKKCRLVESLEEADIVFLVEASFTAHAEMRTPAAPTAPPPRRHPANSDRNLTPRNAGRTQEDRGFLLSGLSDNDSQRAMQAL